MNLNSEVRFILTPAGEKVIEDHYAEIAKMLPVPLEIDWRKLYPSINDNNARAMLLWQLMMIFGPHTYHGCDVYFKDNNITVCSL